MYPRAEMAIVCVLMNHFNLSSYEAENAAASWDLDLDGLVPDNTTVLRAHADLDTGWLEDMVAETAKACLEKAGVGEASEVDTAADSTGAETDRYAERSRTETGKETVTRAKSYLKWYVFAVLKRQIILSCAMTPGNVADTDMLPPLLEKARKLGRSFAGWRLHADKEGPELQGRLGHGHAPQHRAEEEQGEQRQQAQRRQAFPAPGHCYLRSGAPRKLPPRLQPDLRND